MTHQQLQQDNRLLPAPVRWLVWVSLALSLLLVGGCAKTNSQEQTQPVQTQPVQTQEGQPPEIQSPGGREQTMIPEEEAQRIAISFLRNSPTFRFDGMENTLKLVGSEAGEKAGNRVFRYQFQSRQAGYGDRTGMILAQVITDHRAEIVVAQSEVVQAVLDGRWDELRQKMIQ